MPTIAIPQSGNVLQVDQAASGSSVAQRDSSGNLTMARCTASSINNTGAELVAVGTTVTTTYAVVAGDRVIKADATGGTFAITLPAAASSTGRRLTFIKINSANTVTLTGSGSELINGANTKAMTTQYSAVNLVCDGTQWWTET